MDTIPRTDEMTLLMMNERGAREALADALYMLASYTDQFAYGKCTREVLYLAESVVHRAQADLQRVLARHL
jgi:hypothetical protein